MVTIASTPISGGSISRPRSINGLVRNMRKVGVLTARVIPDLEALGISLAAA